MSVTTIKDPRIKMLPTKQLLLLIKDNIDLCTELPQNFVEALKSIHFTPPSHVTTIADETTIKTPRLSLKLLKELKNNLNADTAKAPKPTEPEAEKPEFPTKTQLLLTDLYWLQMFLLRLRKEREVSVYLHELVQSCKLELPQNEFIERSPELEARCQLLREQQQNREYRKMTKNVDAVLKHYPEDTIAYQMKTLNSQIIAVLQFVFSVVAGFVFGFLGIELIVGNLEFGFRLLLGIMAALIIALAEIYFLAKKLNEYDNTTDNLKNLDTPKKNKKKPHVD